MSDVVAWTQDYEAWLRARMQVVEADLQAKHAELATSSLRLLRGTYYYWLRRMQQLQPDLLAAPSVALVGDLHAENFGTWRDHHGTVRWGVNDLDELGQGPYPIDLVRLATSCVLSPHIAVDDGTVCDVLLDGWMALAPGKATKVDDADHLRHLLPEAHGKAGFYLALSDGEPVDEASLPAEVVAAVAKTVDGTWRPSWHRRRAGTGSLGHPRIVAVQESTAREVKLLGPPSAGWAGVTACTQAEGLYDDVMHAVRGPSPATRIDGWQLRALAPDEVRIELSALHAHATERVLRSMAQAVVNVHGVRALDQAREHAGTLPKRWLHDAVSQLAEDTKAAFADWRDAQQS